MVNGNLPVTTFSVTRVRCYEPCSSEWSAVFECDLTKPRTFAYRSVADESSAGEVHVVVRNAAPDRDESHTVMLAA